MCKDLDVKMYRPLNFREILEVMKGGLWYNE